MDKIKLTKGVYVCMGSVFQRPNVTIIDNMHETVTRGVVFTGASVLEFELFPQDF